MSLTAQEQEWHATAIHNWKGIMSMKGTTQLYSLTMGTAAVWVSSNAYSFYNIKNSATWILSDLSV